MNRPTSGPWIAQIGSYHAEIRANGEYVASVQANYVTPNLEKVLDGTGEANARLIASAPALLEALEIVRQCLERHVDEDGESEPMDCARALQAAQDAIAKARGL